MTKRRKSVVVGLLIGLPGLMWIAWLASGREVFTKAGKAAQVAVRDELFGDTVVQTRFVPGPILGHYVGLDLAIAATVAALVVGAILWWLGRRRERQQRGAAQVNRGQQP